MSDNYQQGSITYKRREANLPSVKRHAIRACIASVLVVAGLGVGYTLMGDQHDAIAEGQIGIEKAPLPASSDNLAGNGTDLPDLLQGVVAEGVNPTEQLDALGNPSGSNSLAGANPQPVQQIASVRPVEIGPRTIMIDGKPIVGGGYSSAIALPRAPFADIVRSSPFGPVPTVSPTGNKARNSYARPFTPNPGKAQVSLIIGGLGIDRNLTQRIIAETPSEVTLSFAAHANGLQTWIHQARERGHEVLIELPMEGHNFNPAEPGATRTLKADANPAINIRNLDRLMASSQGYFAVTNYNGSRLISNPAALKPILQHLENSGVGFIYDGSGDTQNLAATAASVNLQFKSAYTIIDNASEFSLIQTELSRLEAASSGGAPQIGVGFALPETFMAVKSWTSSLEAKGLELAPASYILNR